MAGYKLATYQSADGPRAGLVIDDKIFDAAKLTGKAAYASVLAILEFGGADNDAGAVEAVCRAALSGREGAQVTDRAARVTGGQ